MAGRLAEVVEWFNKAANELLAAKVLGAGMEQSVVHHAQQAAERALKALLTAFSQDFTKAKNLAALFGLGAIICPPLKSMNPNLLGNAATAVATAEQVLETIRTNLPADIRKALQ